MTSVPTQLSDYAIQGELGRGSYGVVYRVLNKRDNQIYVLKKISVSLLSSKHQNDALKEVQILKQLNHPHIIKYYTSFVEDNAVNIIMEFAEGGDLHRLLRVQRDKQRHFPEKELWRYAHELSSAIAYLHQRNIIHRDIKCMNVLLSKDKRVKLGDLGASKMTGAAAMQLTRVGTPLYLAPELVKQSPYDFKVDVWALGCVMYLLAAMEAPFQGDNLIALGNAIVSKKPKPIPPLYSTKLSSFIMRLLEKRPKDRPTIVEAVSLIPYNARGKLELVPSIEDLSTNFTLVKSIKEEPIPPIPPLIESPVHLETEEWSTPRKSEGNVSPKKADSGPNLLKGVSGPLKEVIEELERPITRPNPFPVNNPDPVPLLKEDSTVREEPVPVPKMQIQRPLTASSARISTPNRVSRIRVTVRNLQETGELKPTLPLISVLRRADHSHPEGLSMIKPSDFPGEPKALAPSVSGGIIEAKAPLVMIGISGNKVSDEEKQVLRRIFEQKRPHTAVTRVRIMEDVHKDKEEQIPLVVDISTPSAGKQSARPMSAAPKSGKLNPLFKPPKLQSLLHPNSYMTFGVHMMVASGKKKLSVNDLNSS